MPSKVSWRDHPRGPYITLFSGQQFFLKDPRPEEMRIADICRHTAGINRYTGGSRYTVAQHQVVAARMAKRFYPEERLLPARMAIHDADEFAYGDVSSPLKFLLPDYQELEQKAQLAIEDKFDLTFIGDPLVDEVDLRMWLSEREYMHGCGGSALGVDYHGPLLPFPIEPGDDSFEEWPAKEAESALLEMYQEFFPWLR